MQVLSDRTISISVMGTVLMLLLLITIILLLLLLLLLLLFIVPIVGVPSYSAPEVFSGKDYNEKCDVWSIGIIMYIL